MQQLQEAEEECFSVTVTYPEIDPDDDQQQLIYYKELLEIRDLDIHERYLNSIQESPPPPSLQPSPPPRHDSSDLSRKFRLSIPKEMQSQDQEQQDNCQEKADQIIEHALLIIDQMNSNQLELRLAKNRFKHLCGRHLVLDDRFPKPTNKVGYMLLKNGIFCMLLILLQGENEARVNELYERLQNNIQFFKKEFRESRNYQQNSLAGGDLSTGSRRIVRTRDRTRSKSRDSKPEKHTSNQRVGQRSPSDFDIQLQKYGRKVHFEPVDEQKVVAVRRSSRLSKKNLSSHKRGNSQVQIKNIQQFKDYRALEGMTVQDESIIRKMAIRIQARQPPEQSRELQEEEKPTQVEKQAPRESAPAQEKGLEETPTFSDKNQQQTQESYPAVHPVQQLQQLKIIIPNVNLHNIFALVQLDPLLATQFESLYALVPIKPQKESESARKRRLSMDKEKMWKDRESVELLYGRDIPIVANHHKIQQLLNHCEY